MTQSTFNAWTTLFFVAALQAFFVAFVLWRWHKGHRLGNQLLAFLLLLFGAALCEYVAWWTGYVYRFPHLAQMSAQFPFLFGPLLFFYFRAIYLDAKIERRDWLHLLPFVIGLLAFLPFYSLSAAEKQAHLAGNSGFPMPFWVVVALRWGRIAHMMAYVAFNFWFIRQQPCAGATAQWANRLNIFFLGFALAYLSYYVLVQFPFFNVTWDYHISAVMTAMIYLIAYAGYVQPAVFEGFTWDTTLPALKYQRSSLTVSASQSLARRLAELMETERLFQASDLRLDELSTRLDASKHHVSQVINEQFGVSFFEYVNRLRVEEAQRLLGEKTKGELNIIEVAYTVGFNNKASFNTAFKKVVGMTPTEFRRAGAAVERAN